MVLSDKDIETYNFIKDYMLETGFVPSVREIGEGIKLRSNSSVFTHMKRLEDYGLLIRKCEDSPVYRLAGIKYVLED